MHITQVDNSFIKQIGFDPKARVLEVTLENGTWQYPKTEESEYKEFISAESKSRYFRSKIVKKPSVRIH